MTRFRMALFVLAIALGALPSGSVLADKADKADKSDPKAAAPKEKKAPAAPRVTIEDFRTWTEQRGEEIWYWWSWKVVTRYPAGSTTGVGLTGAQRADYEQNRKQFNSTERAAYYKAWASFIDSEIKRGNDINGGRFNVIGGQVDLFRPYQGQARHKGILNNLDLMRAGRPPIGPDGKALNLHHIDPLIHGGTNSFNNFALMTATFHQQHFKELHSKKPGVVNVTTEKFRMK